MQVMERPRLPPGASKDSIDVCLVCDTTASMGVHVKAEALALHAASQELKRAYAGCNLRCVRFTFTQHQSLYNTNW
jgi:hypothetical protein